MSYTIHIGDAADTLDYLESDSIQCCITSPPYWGLRDYGHAAQIGLESSLAEYLDRLVAVFAQVRRVLRPDGTLWVNLGDAYAGSWSARGRGEGTNAPRPDFEAKHGTDAPARRPSAAGVKAKDLIGIPWRLAFALQDAGWYLRSDIIWHKPNAMPESVGDRPTKAHEYLFMLSKSPKYHYDMDATREPHSAGSVEKSARGRKPSAKYADGAHPHGRQTTLHSMEKCCHPLGRNRRTVWTVATANYRGAHSATFPPKLVEPCILAGCPVGGLVLDPFAGSGTTGAVALTHGRQFVGIELNPGYAALARARCDDALQKRTA